MLYAVSTWRVDLLRRRGYGSLLLQHHHRETGADTDGKTRISQMHFIHIVVLR